MAQEAGRAVPTPRTERVPLLQRLPVTVRVAGILLVLYVFLSSIGVMEGGFKSMGRGFAESLIRATSNPFIGLFVGILTTSIVQSSSLTTSIVVGMVSAGTLTVRGAIPIVMGANIGTTVTCTLVSLGFIGRREEFRRAFASSTVHDCFNLLCVLVFFPVEMLGQHLFGMGPLEWAAHRVADLLVGAGSVSFAGPVKTATAPLVGALKAACHGVAGPGMAAAWTMVVLAFVLIFAALWAVTTLMRSLMLGKMEAVLDHTVGRSAALGVTAGFLLTAIIQSSSITTSIMVPLAAAGIINLQQIFPITVGANIGTTVTALMASLGGSPLGLHIALVHLLFNTSGAMLFVPLRAMRRVPMGLATLLSDLTLRSRWFAVAYIAIVFFIIPCALIFLT